MNLTSLKYSGILRKAIESNENILKQINDSYSRIKERNSDASASLNPIIPSKEMLQYLCKHFKREIKNHIRKNFSILLHGTAYYTKNIFSIY